MARASRSGGRRRPARAGGARAAILGARAAGARAAILGARAAGARAAGLGALAAACGCTSLESKGTAPRASDGPATTSRPETSTDVASLSPGSGAAGLPAGARGAGRIGAPQAPARSRPGLPPGVVSIKVPAPPSPFGHEPSVHAVDLDATHVFFNDGFGRIWGARKGGEGGPFEVLAGSSPSRPNPPGGVHALNLLADGDDVVFTAGSGLWRVAKAGGAPRPLTSGKHDPVMLAADEGFLYFSTFDGSPIRRMPKAGGEATAVTEGIKSGAIAVDGAHLFVAVYARGLLVRVPKAGGRPATLAAGLPKPVGIAIDEGAVYFPCESDGSVRRVPKAGGAPKVIARGQSNHDELVLDREYVYWASWDPGGGALRRVRKDGSGPAETLLAGLRGPEGLAVDDANVYVANKGFGEVLVVPKAGVDGVITYPPASDYP